MLLTPDAERAAAVVAAWEPLDEILEILDTETTAYTDGELDEFDALCDKFFTGIVKQHGQSVVSNYVHWIGACHLTEFMRRFGGLKRYSNSGWECLNKWIQRWYHQHTQRRGNQGRTSKDGKKKAKLEKISASFGKMWQQQMFVRCGMDPEFRWVPKVKREAEVTSRKRGRSPGQLEREESAKRAQHEA